MKRIFFIALSLFLVMTAQAKIHWGIRGGYNITTLSFSENDWSTENRSGFYVGPTIKVGVLGLGLDVSATYEQRNISSSQSEYNELMSYRENTLITNKRQTLSFPVNVRYSFGLGDNLSIFAFAGPQFDISLNKDIDDQDFKWNWEKNTWSVNVGFGLTVLSHVEVRANYNIPCNNTFTFSNIISNAVDGINCKAGAWQIGAAIYF